jgi:Terminase small subunit
MLRKAKVSEIPESRGPRNRSRKNSSLRTAEKQRKKQKRKVGSPDCLRTGNEQAIRDAAEVGRKPTTPTKLYASLRWSELRNGLTDRQRRFILEKIAGLNDKDAALAAGYSLSVAENTKQRVWKNFGTLFGVPNHRFNRGDPFLAEAVCA